MQEEVTQKTIALVVKTTKLDANVLKAAMCIFRKNCATVPEERSAIPLQTEQSSAG